MYQSWRQLLFLHWEFDPRVIQRTLPPGLTVDTYEGRAYLGVVPFLMRNIRPRFLPALPGVSNFLETNVRTYVHDENGTPGVWFYSLDANQWLAVRTARRFFHLPYFDAQMQAESTPATTGTELDYATTRRDDPAQTASRFIYRGSGAARVATPGTLEFFLAERYYLFAYDARRKRLFSGQVHHAPYPLQDASVTQWSDRLLELAGFESPAREPDNALYSEGVDVDIFSIQRV